MTRSRTSTAAVWLALACLVAGGCATTAPRVPPRAATEDEKLEVGRALVPLLIATGMWRGAADGCAAVLGILPADSINLSVGPHPACKFVLVVTEGALKNLTTDQLQAALAHELGHVRLGHFAARQERRAAERGERPDPNDKGSVGQALITAIPGIGPLFAVGVMGVQVAGDVAIEGKYRAYDRQEELAADGFALDLLAKLLGDTAGCRAMGTLLERLSAQRSSRLWSSWLGTHPSPGDRLKAMRARCTG
jgi:Zn-dependent protease with chaperone function